jgi:hypothetical protein
VARALGYDRGVRGMGVAERWLRRQSH